MEGNSSVQRVKPARSNEGRCLQCTFACRWL